jgi:hypothetical protein
MTLIDATIQWVFLFAIVIIFFVPAYKFGNLAGKYGKRAWVYFVVGLIVGIVGFSLGNLIVFPLKYYVPREYFSYLTLVLFVSWYVFYRFSYQFLKTRFTGIKE